jgi:AbrB family looped-hinge helix DNA binding protein
METIATSKGQIVIPAEVRRKFSIKKGTRIAIQVDEASHAIVLKPITEKFIKSLRGIDRGTGMLEALAEERKLERQGEQRKVERFTGRNKKRR